MIISYYLKKKKINLENNSRVPPQNPPMSPASQNLSLQAPQEPRTSEPHTPEPHTPEPHTPEQQVPEGPRSPVRPLEPRNDINGQNEQEQVNVSKRRGRKRGNNQENQNNPQKKKGQKTKIKIIYLLTSLVNAD